MIKALQILGIVACLIGIFVLGSRSIEIFTDYQLDHLRDRREAAEDLTEVAKRSAASCRSIVSDEGFFDWVTCLADFVAADGGAKQAEHELEAQQDMAAWALGMLVVNSWLVVTSLAGLILVYRTLRATQLMANETTRIGEAQTRAHINFGVRHLVVSYLPGDKEGRCVVCDIAAHNSGNTIGSDLFAEGRLIIKDEHAAVVWQRDLALLSPLTYLSPKDTFVGSLGGVEGPELGLDVFENYKLQAEKLVVTVEINYSLKDIFQKKTVGCFKWCGPLNSSHDPGLRRTK